MEVGNHLSSYKGSQKLLSKKILQCSDHVLLRLHAVLSEIQETNFMRNTLMYFLLGFFLMVVTFFVKHWSFITILKCSSFLRLLLPYPQLKSLFLLYKAAQLPASSKYP